MTVTISLIKHGLHYQAILLLGFYIEIFNIYSLCVYFQLKLKQSPVYIVSGLLMIFIFFIVRICIFPYLYWQYSQFSGTPFLDVPRTIPLKCNLGCSLILILQFYFMYLMVRGACRVFYKIYKSKVPKDR